MTSAMEIILTLFSRMVLCDYSGSQQYDLLMIIRKINRHGDFPTTYIPLSQGDVIENQALVIWPPRVIENKSFNETVKKVMEKCEPTISEYPKFKKLYEQMNTIPGEQGKFSFRKEEVSELVTATVDVPKPILDLGPELKGIANRLSVVFMLKNRLLFLGDLETFELGEAVKYLKSSSRFNHCEYLIAPHHGTHWNDELLNIFAGTVLVSNGEKMIKHFERHFQEICNQIHCTFAEGSFRIKPFE
jgi:hypothetical protein